MYIRLDGLGVTVPPVTVNSSTFRPVGANAGTLTSGGTRSTTAPKTIFRTVPTPPKTTTPAAPVRGPGLTTGTTITYRDGSAPSGGIVDTIKDIFGSVFGAATAVAPTVAEVLAAQRQRREEERLREEEAMRQANMPQSSSSWLLPVGIAGAALLVVGVMMSRKKETTALEPVNRKKTNPRRRRR